MTTIINLRGTNGSGKSSAAVSLLADPVEIALPEAGVSCLGDGQTILIGPYPEGRIGGCDRIKTFDQMRLAIEEAALGLAYPVVVFEGITVATTFGSWADFCRKLPFWWVYLDTPLDLCIQRIYARNGGQSFKEDMVRDKYTAIDRTRLKAMAAGFNVAIIDHRDPYAGLQAIALLD